MQKFIFSLVLITFFVLFSMSAYAGIWERLYDSASYASVSYDSRGHYNVRVDFGRQHNVNNINVINVRQNPYHSYLHALSRAPAPSFRSLPDTTYSRNSHCTFVSKSPTYSRMNVKKGYAQGYYRC